MKDCKCVNENHQGLSALGRNGRERRIDAFSIGHLEVAGGNSQASACVFDLLELQALVRITWIEQHCNSSQTGYKLLEHLQALAGKLGMDTAQSRRASAGPSEALDQLVERIARNDNNRRVGC